MPLDQAAHEALDGDVEPDFPKADFRSQVFRDLIFRVEALPNSICGFGTDHAPHSRDAICRKPSAACVFANRFLIRR